MTAAKRRPPHQLQRCLHHSFASLCFVAGLAIASIVLTWPTDINAAEAIGSDADAGVVVVDDSQEQSEPTSELRAPDYQKSTDDAYLEGPAFAASNLERRTWRERLLEDEYLLGDSWLHRFGVQYEKRKSSRRLPITLSAWHWWHTNTGGPAPSGYGLPGADGYPDITGTYYYGVEFDPSWEVQGELFDRIRSHVNLQFRDGGSPIRPYYPNDSFWLYEGYLAAHAGSETIKVGAIERRFGLAWDGTFWGSVPYYDGYKLSTSWGVSWEDAPEMTDNFKLDRSLQLLLLPNVDLAEIGATPFGVYGSKETVTAVSRIVPTFQLSETKTLAWGISALVGGIKNDDVLSVAGVEGLTFASPGSQTHVAWGTDVSYTAGDWHLFAEFVQSFGVVSPYRYVSLGPSNRQTSVLTGVHRQVGPIQYRFNYSTGFDDNPSGTQHLWVPGVTVSLTKNVEFMAEYVNQILKPSGASKFESYENGCQFIVHWRL